MNHLFRSLSLLSIAMLFFTSCGPSSRDLDKMLKEGKFDQVIELGNKRIAEHPEDFGTLILIGDAYYQKGVKFNQEMHRRYTPEAAAFAKRALDYYRKAKKYTNAMRVDQKMGFAAALISP